MIQRLKLLAASILQHVPGKVGARFENTLVWHAREARLRSATATLEQELARLGPESIAMDLGANVGDVTARLAAVCGHVHAFEPDPWAFARLSERAASWDNVTLHNAAMGAADGTVTLHQDPRMAEDPETFSVGSSTQMPVYWRDQAPPAVEVPQVGIVGFLEQLGRPVDFIKVDIEGGEVAVLNALLDSPMRAQVHSMLVETHEFQIPELRPAIRDLRQRVAALETPRIALDWH